MNAHLEYDHAELDRQFNPELAEPDFLEHLNRYAAASDRVRKTHRSLLDVAYEATLRNVELVFGTVTTSHELRSLWSEAKTAHAARER